jgi:hypothetical protein
MGYLTSCLHEAITKMNHELKIGRPWENDGCIYHKKMTPCKGTLHLLVGIRLKSLYCAPREGIMHGYKDQGALL